MGEAWESTVAGKALAHVGGDRKRSERCRVCVGKVNRDCVENKSLSARSARGLAIVDGFVLARGGEVATKRQASSICPAACHALSHRRSPPSRDPAK